MKPENEHKNPTQLHQEKLGMEIPEGFFSNSKQEILKQIEKPQVPVRRLFGLRPVIAYPIAASLIIMIGIAAWQFYSNSYEENGWTFGDGEIEMETDAEDVLLSSIILDEEGFDRFTDDYLFNQVILKAEQDERELEDVFINSILVEDSLIDNYMDENFLDEIIF